MRDTLAERLLAEVMQWNPEDLAKELPYLQALASIKYDEYQQFSPGMRFLESLAMWLDQFEKKDERDTAYLFVRSQLVFISNEELFHLVNIAYPDKVRPYLINQVAERLAIPDIKIRKIVTSREFKVLLRQSLFIGLTEGAHLDIFRRSNPVISHEQTLLSYDISEEKIKSVTSKLKSDLRQLIGEELCPNDCKFNNIFLIDDFSASGLSYIRKDGAGDYNGKIAKILNNVYSDNKGYINLVNRDNLQISLLVYIATNKARSHLQNMMEQWFNDNKIQGRPKIFVVQELPEKICIQDGKDDKLIETIKHYYDDSIQDEHYEVGDHQKPYLGFDECALPLVLSHNTPNNSIPILWFDSFRKYLGLFPRISRHKEVTK